MARFVHHPIEVLPDGTVRTCVSGFSYGDFLRTGLPSVWGIMKRFEQIWCLAELGRSDIVLFPKTPTGCRPVVVYQTLEIHQGLYSHRGDFVLVAKRGPVTKKRVTLHLSLQNESYSEVLCKTVLHYVTMDTSTKKVRPISDPTWLDYIQETAPSQMKTEPIPIRHFLSRVRPAHSDTDCLYHVNPSSYSRFCMDAAAARADTGHLNNFKGDLFAYKVRHVGIIYQKEALPSDDLDINCWEDTNSKETLNFQITRGTSNVVYSSIKFY